MHKDILVIDDNPDIRFLIWNILKEQNFNVVKYLPYGPIFESIPYLIRRLNENSSVSEHSKKELHLIYNEIKKRK